MPDFDVQRGPRSLWEHLAQRGRAIFRALAGLGKQGWRWLESWRWRRRARQYASDPERSLQEIQKLEGWAYTQVLNGEGKQGAEVFQTLCKHHPHKANQPVIEQMGWFHILADWGNIWSKTLLTAGQGVPGGASPAPPEKARDTLAMLQRQPETWEHLFRTLVLARQHLENQDFNIHGSILLLASRQPGVRQDPGLKELLVRAGGLGVLQNLARHARGQEFRRLLFRLLQAGAGGEEVAARVLKGADPEQIRGLEPKDIQQLLQREYEPLREAALLGIARMDPERETTVH